MAIVTKFGTSVDLLSQPDKPRLPDSTLKSTSPVGADNGQGGDETASKVSGSSTFGKQAPQIEK